MDSYQNVVFYCSKCDEQNVIYNKITSFIKSIKNNLINNFTEVTEIEKESRISICQSCEFFNDQFQTCRICGCLLKIKTSLVAENCPINKW